MIIPKAPILVYCRLTGHHEIFCFASVRLTSGNSSTFAHYEPLVSPAELTISFFTGVLVSVACGSCPIGMYVPHMHSFMPFFWSGWTHVINYILLRLFDSWWRWCICTNVDFCCYHCWGEMGEPVASDPLWCDISCTGSAEVFVTDVSILPLKWMEIMIHVWLACCYSLSHQLARLAGY